MLESQSPKEIPEPSNKAPLTLEMYLKLTILFTWCRYKTKTRLLNKKAIGSKQFQAHFLALQSTGELWSLYRSGFLFPQQHCEVECQIHGYYSYIG